MKKPTLPPAPSAGKAPALSPEIVAKVQERNKILEWLKKRAAREMELRRDLAAFFVPKPKEGTNRIEGEGYEVKVGHTVSRKLDAASLDAVMVQFPEGHPARVVGNLIQYKPALVLDFYRTLSDEDRKIFDQALTISDDGAPTLEIVIREEVTPDLARVLGDAIEDAKRSNPPSAATPAPAPAATTSHSAPNTAPTRKPATKKKAVGSSAKPAAKPAPKAKGKPDLKAIFAKPAPKKPAKKK